MNQLIKFNYLIYWFTFEIFDRFLTQNIDELWF